MSDNNNERESVKKREPWYESDNPDRVSAGLGARIAVWTVIAVLFFGAVGIGVWAFKVTTSGVKGAGDATRITNDGRNRVNSQEWFEGQYAAIVAADTKLDQAAADKAANPKDQFAATNYTGLVNRCIDMVNAYNAEANKVSRGQWRSPSLPAQIDPNDTITDCKENSK